MENIFISPSVKALERLKLSYEKIKNASIPEENSPDDSLEKWESFSSRFARSSDLFISKFLRFKVLEIDPEFRGSLIDMLNIAEKNSLIDDAQLFLKCRELRNLIAHEYLIEGAGKFFEELRAITLEYMRVVENALQ